MMFIFVTSAESTQGMAAFIYQGKGSCNWKCVMDAVQRNHPTGYTDSTCLTNTKGGSSKYLEKVFYFLVSSLHREIEVDCFPNRRLFI